MLRFEKNVEDRKVMVSRLGELVDVKPHYTMAPRMAFEIGDWTVERDGTLTVDDDKANADILHTLSEEGLIKMPETEENNQSAEPEEAHEELAVNIALPLTGHTGNSLRNLVNLIYQRADLINKATASHFKADLDLVNALKNETDLPLEKALEILAGHRDDLIGVGITEDKIVFTGFPELADSDTLRAYMDLACHMNSQAISQKRIYPKYVDDTSEKYAFRIWLTRLGMNGSEFKTTRKILMKNLSGYAAFRNKEEAEKFYAAQKAKHEAAKESTQEQR
ncbi:MAG: hypothetical protein SOU32_11120 [Lachnospiraceae bacterium]|nr:hypothetical protein [Lachnospiraceae bacterium]